MALDARIKIEEAQTLPIERNGSAPLVDDTDSFEKAYITGLERNKINILDGSPKIGRNDDNSFSICGMVNWRLTECVKVTNSTLLVEFISHVMEKHNRAALKTLSNTIRVNIATTNKPRPKENGVTFEDEIIEEIVIQEELEQLKADITFKQIIEKANALTTGGRVTLADGTRKHFKDGLHEEITQIIRNLPKEDDIVYNQNLSIFKQIIDEQKENVIMIKKNAKDLKKDIFTAEDNSILQAQKQELDYIYAQYMQIKEYIARPRLMNQPFDASISNIDLAIYSSQDINMLQTKIGIQDKELRDINIWEFNTTLLKLDLDDRQKFRVYLNDVISGKKNPGINPTTDKYTPRNVQSFRDICATYPFVTWYIQFPEPQTGTNNNTAQNSAGNIVGNNTWGNDKDNVGDTTPEYADRRKAFAKWWPVGLAGYGLDQTKMNSEQKQFRGGVGQLAMTAGTIFMGRKMIKSAFNLITWAHKGKEGEAERRKDLAWLLGPVAIMFGAHALTGEWPLALLKGGKGTERIASWFSGGKKNEKNGDGETPEQQKKNTELKNTYAEGFPGITAVFHGLSYGQISEFVEEKDGKIKIKEASHETLIKKMQLSKNKAGESFLKSIGKDDNQYIIDLAFKGMGISMDKLQDNNNKDKQFDETASKSIVKLNMVYTFMEKEWYSRINPDNIIYIEKFIANEHSDLDDLIDLGKRTDIFMKELPKDETGLGAQLKTLANGNSTKETWLLIGINRFYEYMPSADKKIELGDDPKKLKFKTYWEETEIDIDDKRLNGFTPTAFDSFFELFKAASLTNYIKKVCKEKVAIKEPPFYISAGGDITFDNAKLFSKDFDTEILSGGIRWSLEKISPTLEKYKKDYRDYLNGGRFWKPAPATA